MTGSRTSLTCGFGLGSLLRHEQGHTIMCTRPLQVLG